MRHRERFFCGLFVLFLMLGMSPWAHAQKVLLPSETEESVRAVEAVPVQTLETERTNEQLKAQAKTDGPGPEIYGTVLGSQFTPGRHGTWERLSSGDWLWRLRIRSEEALSLSVGFDPFDLPSGATLFTRGEDDSVVRGPYRAEDATGGQHRVPLVPGDEVVVELLVPAGRRADVNLEIDRVVHGFRPALDLPNPADGTLRKSASCNVDVVCGPGWDWDDQIRSVGAYTFETEGGDVGACSGALVNNTGDSPRPYFLTAEHCVSTPQQVKTMNFLWNYQSQTCRRPGSDESGNPLPRQGDTSSGAVLRARYGSVHEDGGIAGKSDLILVEVDDEIPDDYDLYLSGWDRSGNTTEQAIGIHHPSAHAKRISIDRDPSSKSGWAGSGGDTHFTLGDWELGTMEGGSSGSPMFDGDKRIVGVLSGGFVSECGGGDVLYGRIAPGFNQGDYFSATLADFLDPEDTGQQTLDGQDLSPDSTPPAKPSSFQVRQGGRGLITLSWTAPGDDGSGGGPVDRYELRYRSESPITSLDDLEGARRVETNLPEPAAPGTRQEVTIEVDPDSTFYFGIAAFDDVLQPSPVASLDDGLAGVEGIRVFPVRPSPARQRATASVVVEKKQSVEVGLYDALGRRVALLLDEELDPYRTERLTIDTRSLSSGVYFLHAVGETGSSTQKVSVVQ